MRATKKSRTVADDIEVNKHGEGVTYRCRRCGFQMDANAYYEQDYKTMVQHIANCQGQPQQVESLQALQVRDIETLNDQVKFLAGHIKKCIPNGNELSNEEAIALARISMATDLSPFTGELFYIHEKGPHIGIRGLRRKAKEQALYSKSARPMTPEEIEEHDVRTEIGDVGYICELFRHDVTQQAATINQMAGQPIIPIQPIIGVGIWRKAYKEIHQYKDDPVPHGKSAATVAKKRAEADALNQAYDVGKLPYSDHADDLLQIADAEDADWSVLPPDLDDETIRREVAINAARHIPAEKPAWALKILQQIAQDPQASDPVNGDFVQQLKVSMERRGIVWARGMAFVEALLNHRVEECTQAEARVLMALVNDHDDSLADKIADLLG